VLARVDEVAAPVEPLRLIAQGAFNWVFETGSGFIVRVGRTAEAAERHAIEARMLRWLAGRSTVPVPSPAAVLPAGPGLAFGALVYRKLPGRLMLRAEALAGGNSALAGDLGQFFAGLHRIPLAQARELGLPAYQYALHPELPSAALRSVRARAWPALRQRLATAELSAVDRWWDDFFADPSLRATPEVICHGDLWPGNLLVGDDGRLAGVLDWEWISIADPSADLGKRVDFSAAFWDAFLSSYQRHGGSVDESTRARMLRWSEFRIFEALTCHVDDDALRESDILDLRALPWMP
jgi:aminoglycoside phosphotransferase (APT) family kinase protein